MASTVKQKKIKNTIHSRNLSVFRQKLTSLRTALWLPEFYRKEAFLRLMIKYLRVTMLLKNPT